MPPTNRRPCAIDTSMHCCPHEGCDYRGWLGLGNLRANGHPSGGPWRQFHCTACKGYFPEHHGTLFHGKRVAPEKLIWAVGAVAEGLGIRAVARVFEVDPNTVLQWLVEVADQLQAFPEGAEISLDAVRQVRLGAVQGFIEHDQGLGDCPASAVEQQVSEQAVRHAERMARKINAVLETDLNGPFDQGHRRSLQRWTRRFHRKFKQTRRRRHRSSGSHC